MLLSIVVPCHNEAAGLPALYKRLTEVAERLTADIELILVDDGSADETASTMRNLADIDDRVRYILLSRNFGKESAMLAGLRSAQGAAVVVMDADLQHPPELLPELLAAHHGGADQVVARRDRRGEPFRRRMLSRLYYRIVNGLVDVRLVDGDGDFRLLSRRALDALLELSEYNRFSKGLFAWIGFPVATVPMPNAEREYGTTSWTFRKLLNYGLDGVISFNSKPLRSAIHLGVILVIMSAAYLVWQIISTLMFGVDSPGYLTLLAAIIGLGGAQMILLGVIGEYIGRIFSETKKRPHYIVMESNLPRGGRG